MTVTQLTNTICGESLQSNVRQTSVELASVQAGCGVHSLFRPSYTDLETGMHGIRWLIARILTQRETVLPVAPRHDNKPFEFRNVYIGSGMTTEEICKAVRLAYCDDKYPLATIEQNLSVVMRKAGQVRSIQMTSEEDSERNSFDNRQWRIANGRHPICKRSRHKWYLVAE
jgi:hypothetical protein